MTEYEEEELARLIDTGAISLEEVAETKARKLRAALLAVMREWNRDVEYATVPTRAWRQAEDALGQKIAPRDLRTLIDEAAISETT